MKALPLLLALALLAPLCADGQKRRVKTRIKVAREALVPEAFIVSSADSASGYSVSQVEITDYQKPAGSDKETFSLTNLTDKPLAAIELQIEYLTPEGRQIHKRTVKADCDVPPGETRIVELRSWDRQRSWYYARGQKPRKQASPYEVKLEVAALHLRID